VLVTAWNPNARLRSRAENRAAERYLSRRLRALHLTAWPTLAEDPAGRWPGEPGLLIFDVPEQLARALGHALRQRAVVFVAADAVPQLLWI
jgi:hypothetical protein